MPCRCGNLSHLLQPEPVKPFCFLLAAILLASSGFAQPSSGIFGSVFDSLGRPLIQHPVVIYQGGREVTRSYTDDAGTYVAKPLSPNVYEVRAEVQGKTRTVTPVDVGVADLVHVNFDFSQPPAAQYVPRKTAGILVRVVDSAGNMLRHYLVYAILLGIRYEVTAYTDEGGVAHLAPLYYENYDVSVTVKGRRHVVSGIKADSAEVWTMIYVKQPRNPKREQRRGIKAYKKWQRQTAQETDAERQRKLENRQRASLVQSNSSGISIKVLDEDGKPLVRYPVFIYRGRRMVLKYTPTMVEWYWQNHFARLLTRCV